MARQLNVPKAAHPSESAPKENPQASSDPSKAGTRENLNTVFGAPNEDK